MVWQLDVDETVRLDAHRIDRNSPTVHPGRLRDVALNSVVDVAVKKIYVGASMEEKAKVAKEAVVMRGAGEHPNILKLLDYRELEREVYVITEKCLCTFEDIFAGEFEEVRNEIVETLGKIKIASHILDGVCHLHSIVKGHETVHRDIKAGNIFVHRDERLNFVVKIGDFGISKAIDVGRGKTTTNPLQGTQSYMAPELFRNFAAGHVTLEEAKMADVYAVGIIVGQIFADGKHPFGGKDVLYTQLNMREDKRDPMESIPDEVHKNLVYNLTEFDAAHRATAAEARLHPLFKGAEWRADLLKDVHAALNEKGAVKQETTSALESNSEFLFAQNWNDEIHEDIFDRVNKFQLRFLKNTGRRFGYQVHLVKGLLAFYRNLETHKADYSQLMTKHFMTPTPRRDALLEYFDQRFPLFFMHVYGFAVEHFPSVQGMEDELSAHRKFAASFSRSVPRFHPKKTTLMPRAPLEAEEGRSKQKTIKAETETTTTTTTTYPVDSPPPLLPPSPLRPSFDPSIEDAPSSSSSLPPPPLPGLIERARHLFFKRLTPISELLRSATDYMALFPSSRAANTMARGAAQQFEYRLGDALQISIGDEDDILNRIHVTARNERTGQTGLVPTKDVVPRGWYHGHLTPDEASVVLKSAPTKMRKGSFLMRHDFRGMLWLSVSTKAIDSQTIEHFQVTGSHFLYLYGHSRTVFKSVVDLVAHYQIHHLPRSTTRLRFPRGRDERRRVVHRLATPSRGAELVAAKDYFSRIDEELNFLEGDFLSLDSDGWFQERAGYYVTTNSRTGRRGMAISSMLVPREFYLGWMSGSRADEALRDARVGDFLLRKEKSGKFSSFLSVKCPTKTHHEGIYADDLHWFVGSLAFVDSLNLVEYFKRNAGHWGVKLRSPVPSPPSGAAPQFHHALPPASTLFVAIQTRVAGSSAHLTIHSGDVVQAVSTEAWNDLGTGWYSAKNLTRHSEVGACLSNTLVPKDWLREGVGEEEAERLLADQPVGTFMIRRGSRSDGRGGGGGVGNGSSGGNGVRAAEKKKPQANRRWELQGDYSFMLSLKTADGRAAHVGIFEATERYTQGTVWGIKFERDFIDVFNLVDYYRKNKGTWGCLLTQPCPRVRAKKSLKKEQSLDLDLGIFD